MIDFQGKKYYTTEELANMLGKSYETLRRWRNKGILKYITTSYGDVLYSETEVENLLGVNKPSTKPIYEGFPDTDKDILKG